MRKTIYLSLLMLLLAGTFVLSASAATRLVDRSDDESGATACTGAANDCSLRGAITGATSTDTITFASGGIYTINSELLIDKNLTITGTGLAGTFIEPATGVACRIFHVASGVSAVIQDVTVRNGERVNSGAGIHNEGNLTLNRVAVTQCAVTGSYSGGGLYHNGTLMTLNDCTVSSNSCAGGGGGIHSSGPMVINDCSIHGNNAAGIRGGGMSLWSSGSIQISNSAITDNSVTGGKGGGIYSYSSDLTLQNCEVTRNSASEGGGGMYVYTSTLEVDNTTISENTSPGHGGGLASENNFTPSHLSFCTIFNNVADNGNDGDGDGGGLWYTNTSSSGGRGLMLKGNVIAYNTDSSTTTKHPDVSIDDDPTTIQTLGSNFISTNLGAETLFPQGNPNANQDYAGTGLVVGPLGRLDPKLELLADNGGDTRTCALAAGSPLANKGPKPCTDALGAAVTTDQRGETRPFSIRADIGAFESDFRGAVLAPVLMNLDIP